MIMNEQDKEKTFRFATKQDAYKVAFDKVARGCHYFDFDWQEDLLKLPAGCPKGIINAVIQNGGTLVS